MDKRDVCNFKILAIFLLLVGCSDAAPTVALLRSLEGFEFSEEQIVTASLSSVSLTAKCSSYVSKVEVSFDNGATWISPTAHDPSATDQCSGGSFSMKISSLQAPLSSMTISKGQLIGLKFKAQTKVGSDIYRSLTVKYSPSSVLPQELLVGSQIQTGSGLQMRGRARFQQQHAASGGSFAISGRIMQ